MFDFCVPERTWLTVTIIRWLACYVPFVTFMNNAFDHPLAKTLWAPFILFVVGICLNWFATVGVNRLFSLFPKGREYIEWQRHWVATQRGSGISRRSNVYGDTGQVAAFLLLSATILLSALILFVYITEGAQAL